MNEQLRELVRERLSAAADCPAKEDIIEEITADLTEKYNELVSGGAQPEEAMEQVQAGIGDLDEVAAYINEVARRSAENQKAGNNTSAPPAYTRAMAGSTGAWLTAVGTDRSGKMKW